ncbi:MAG: glycosyltransferase family 2 protein [Clostridia bacterium]|nr:glycosyltransferase family 2 protein [Clostridia bacterium]
MKPTISIITPVYNEQDCLPNFFKRVIPIMEKIGLPFEIIAVNDGSKDDSEKILRDECQKDGRVKAVNFSRNFGQQAAFLCGLKNCSGDCAILIDADLQDPPELFPEMIEKWKEGFEVVHGVRRVRKGESFFKKFTSSLFINLLSKKSGFNLPKNSGEFKLYDRKVIDVICSLPERSRFLRVQVAWAGFRQTAVEFDRGERTEGETKFTLKKMLKTAEAGIVPYSPKTLKTSGKLGIVGLILSLLAFATFIVLTCLSDVVGFTLPLTAWLFPTISLATSIILISNGITDLYLGYLYEDVKARPVYIERDKINFGE